MVRALRQREGGPESERGRHLWPGKTPGPFSRRLPGRLIAALARIVGTSPKRKHGDWPGGGLARLPGRPALTLAMAALAWLAAAILPARANGELGLFFLSNNSSPVSATFEHFVDFEYSGKDGADYREEALLAARRQAAYLAGALEYHAFPGFVLSHGPIRIDKIVQEGLFAFRAHYSYSGRMVLTDGIPNPFPIYLPRNPETIFPQTVTTHLHRPHSWCTDFWHQQPQYLWYYWNVNHPFCPRDQLEIDEVEVRYSPDSQQAASSLPDVAPRYDQLVDKGGEIAIHVLVGMNLESGVPGRLVADDVADDEDDLMAIELRKLMPFFSDYGYQRRDVSTAEIEKVAAILDLEENPLPYVAEFTRQLSRATIRVRVFFGPTRGPQHYFHRFYRDALEKSAMLVFKGHSGLGAHLDLENIEATHNLEVALNPAYQIIFLNTCRATGYYRDDLFRRKKAAGGAAGLETLDVISAGGITLLESMADSSMALLDAIHRWADGGRRATYKEILKGVEADNLVSVSGVLRSE